MRRLIIIRFIIIMGCFLFVFHACSTTRVISSHREDLVRLFTSEKTKFVIKDDFNLNGEIIKLGKGSSLTFRGGSFSNGTIVGNNTKIIDTKQNVFHDCRIEGTWILNCSYSSMFNDDLDAMVLFRNLSCLSSNIQLSSNRTYHLASKGEVIEAESISSMGDDKAIIEFHTTNPNIVGLMISGNSIFLHNLVIIDDYDKKNDVRFGNNDITIGSTIGIQSPDQTVNSLIVEGCEFAGGTSSSFIASSQVLFCSIKNCSFSGFMADHAVYCSTKINKFIVQDSFIKDVTGTAGIFKIRASKDLKDFSLVNIKAYNLNGYLVIASLLETPSAQLIFDNITVSKDVDNSSVFYGFCVTDETRSLEGTGRFNAGCLRFNNCCFDYGYNGSSLIYQGSGKRACIKDIEYINSKASYSNFAGAISSSLKVKGCFFYNCTDKGLSLNANNIIIENTSLSQIGEGYRSYMFLINNTDFITERVLFKDVSIDARVTDLFKIGQSNIIRFELNGCNVSNLSRFFFLVKKGSNINYRISASNMITKSSSQEVGYY